MDNTFYVETEKRTDYEAFNDMNIFYSGKETLKQICKSLNEKREHDEKVSEREVLNAIGIEGGRDNWGWTKDKGFHEFTVQEMHPEGCPCCGKPW